jgi:hypothetical protein
MKKSFFCSIIFLGSICLPAIGFGFEGVTLLNDHILDVNNGGDNSSYDDKSVRVDYRQIYLTGYLGNFRTGWEGGGYFQDTRKSTYSGYSRFRDVDQTFQIETDQVLNHGFVGKLEFRYIDLLSPETPTDPSNLYVYGVGMDKYYGDYNYLSVEYLNDPRDSSRFSVIVSNTLAVKSSSFRLGIVPRSDGTIGYFGFAKYHWILLGYAFTKEIDFSTLDRRVMTFGVQMPLDLIW